MIYFYIWRWGREQELLVMFCLQMILNFPQRDCLGTRKVSKLHCLESYWLSFPLFMFNHCNKLSIKVFKHIIFSTKLPHWHRILVIFRMYGWVPKEVQFWIYIWEELFRGQIFCQTKRGITKGFDPRKTKIANLGIWLLNRLGDNIITIMITLLP